MKTTIFENDFVTVNYDESESYMIIIWNKDCGNVINEQYSEIIDRTGEIITNKAPKRLLVDMSACSYSITPDTGPWYENTLFSMYGDLPHGKAAIVLPQNLNVQAFFDAVSAYENTDFKTKIQYFKDAGKAGDWLLSESDQNPG
jgi:hypothetical protein